MKIVKLFICSIIIIYILCACSKTTTSASQLGAYFPEGEERFILVDESVQYLGNEKYSCKVFADKYMLTMYLLIENCHGYGYSGGMTQIFYEDGSPMIYDCAEVLE